MPDTDDYTISASGRQIRVAGSQKEVSSQMDVKSRESGRRSAALYRQIILPAYAKINLFLDILSVREDGYHNIDGIMHAVSLCDYVSVTVGDQSEQRISLECSDPALPAGKGNLAFRAAELFLDETGITGYSVSIKIEKNIPVSAGLAGGSTDAAAVIRALGYIFDIDETILFMIAEKIGSDVAFCLMGGCARTEGTGNVLTPLHPMGECFIVIGFNGSGVSTPEAYGKADRLYHPGTEDERHAELGRLPEIITGKPSDYSGFLFNVFEGVVLPDHAGASELKDILSECGAEAVLMSGSGPSVFGLFGNRDSAETAKRKLSGIGARAFIARPERTPLTKKRL